MKPKEVARLLELIKYFTFTNRIGLSEPGSRIILTSKADVGKTEEIEDKQIKLPNRIVNIESLVIDYGAEYSSSLKSKEIKIHFGKKAIEGSIIGSGPDHHFDTIINGYGLMTPSIIQEHIKDGNSFRRYIFPSELEYNYKIYNDWLQTTLKDIGQRYSRQRSMTILVEQSSTPGFESFLNESLTDWRSRFTTDTINAKSGNFNWFSLYDSKIYEYELSFEDRISILNYMVYSLDWDYIFEGYGGGINGVDEYELFASLITSTSKDDGKKFYDYMFTIDSLTGKTNLLVYKEKLSDDKLYDALLKTLMKFFYSEKSIAELISGFRDYLLYPIGLYEKLGSSYATFNLKTDEYVDPGSYILGVKYKISTEENIDTGKLIIRVNSAYRYKENTRLYRLEFEDFNSIGANEVWNFDEVLYVTSFLSNQKLEGLNIPYGSVMPIPAFALPWLVERNNETEDIIDLIEEAATYTGIIFPVFQISEGVSVIYNIIGIGFTLVNNALDAGLRNQILQYDDFQSNALGQPYTKGINALETYYLFSTIFGGISLRNAIKNAENKIKVLLEFETLLGIKGTLDDINSFMELRHPGENVDSLNIIRNQMNQLQIDYNSYQFLRKNN